MTTSPQTTKPASLGTLHRDNARKDAHTGALRCKTWRAEALLRMLENVLSVGENPDDLIVYASLGKAAINWEAYDTIVETLMSMEEDETLILQTGRPIGVIRTHADAPMVVSAVNNTVGKWSDEDLFYDRMAEGKTMWGGLTAAAWQYIGRQGVLQGTYELLRIALDQRFGTSDGTGRWMLTAGMGGMGSSQPISARMLGLSSVTVEVDRAKADKLKEAGGLDIIAATLNEALAAVADACQHGTPIAVGLVGNAAEIFPAVYEAGVVPDIVTDQTAAHDALYGYVPAGMSVEEWMEKRDEDPAAVKAAAQRSMAQQVTSMIRFANKGSIVFENGNNLRVQASNALDSDTADKAFKTIPGFMEAYVRPLFCRGIGPFRWVALSGSVEDQLAIDQIVGSLFPERPEVAAWLNLAGKHVPQQGLPARSCWLGYGERSAAALAVNEAVADGRLSGPVAFSRDHLDSAGMTNPKIGTEGMLDDSDGVADWPLLDAMLIAASGGDLVAVHSGGGGYSGWMQSCGVTVVADGTQEAAIRLKRTLDADSGLGVLRHATAGYPQADEAIAESTDDQSPWTPLTLLSRRTHHA